MRADPGDEDDEEPRQEHLRGVERRLRRRHAHAADANRLRALLVAVEEHVLAADATQDAKTGRGVGAERRQEADLVALHPLPDMERLDHEAERDREKRDADQDDEAERHRRREQDHRDDDVRDDAADEPRENVERATGTQGVVRDRRDHLTRRQLGPHRVARARSVMADDLGQPERRLQPVLDREAVTERAGNGLNDAEQREQDAEPDERVLVVVDDALLDRLADRVRHQRLRDHPDDPERDCDEDGADLMPPHPDEQPDRRAGIRSPRIGDRKIDHGRATAAAPPPRVPEKRPTRFGVTAGRAACTRCGAARAPRRLASR